MSEADAGLVVMLIGLLCILWCIYRLERRVHRLEHESWIRGQGWRKAE